MPTGWTNIWRASRLASRILPGADGGPIISVDVDVDCHERIGKRPARKHLEQAFNQDHFAVESVNRYRHRDISL